MRLLIIEDDMAAASGLKKIAEGGIPALEVRMATTLAGGIEQAEAAKPDVVALDADLSDSGAFETLNRIPFFVQMGAAVIVFSGYEEDALVTAAFKQGATDFITKPPSTVNVVQRLIYAHLRTIYYERSRTPGV